MNYKIEKKLNVVLFGAGKAGNYHASSILKIKNVSILGVVNSGKKDPKEFRIKYKIDKWIKSYRDLKSIIKNIDAFILASPSEKTLEIIKNISSYNIPCLIEKPLGISIKESSEILSIMKNNNLSFVGYNRRFYSVILHSQYFIKRFGTPFSIHIDAPEPLESLVMRDKKINDVNNRLILNTTHALDILNLFYGDYLSTYNFNQNSLIDGLKIDFMSFIHFKNNNTASFISHWNSPGDWSVKLFGNNYQIKLNLTKNKGEIIIEKTKVVKFSVDNEDKTNKAGILKQNYFFFKSILEKKKAHNNLCTLNEAYVNIKLAEDLK